MPLVSDMTYATSLFALLTWYLSLGHRLRESLGI